MINDTGVLRFVRCYFLKLNVILNECSRSHFRCNNHTSDVLVVLVVAIIMILTPVCERRTASGLVSIHIPGSFELTDFTVEELLGDLTVRVETKGVIVPHTGVMVLGRLGAPAHHTYPVPYYNFF